MNQRTWEILSRSDVEQMESMDWVCDAYGRFKAQMESRGFPCVFGLRGWRGNNLRFVFGDDSDDSGLRLADVLKRYITRARMIGPHTSLVVMYPPEMPLLTADQYAVRFWRILQQLHDIDEAPWPAEIPRDLNHPRWDFSFAGEPLFVPAILPCYQLRHSRCGISFGMMFQPRWVFDKLIEEPSKLDRARAVIRRRAARYDGVPVHPAIGVYGDASNVEWRQYVLPDDNDTVLNQCPLHINGSPEATDGQPLTFVPWRPSGDDGWAAAMSAKTD